MEKSTRPCNFIYFSRSKWFCWTSMWLYMFSLHPSIIPGRRQCISSLCLSFDNLQCQISSMLTWWKVSSICYIVLFGFTTSALHFICPLFVDFDFCFYDLFSFSFLFQLTQSHFVSFDNFFFLPIFRFWCIQTWLSISFGPIQGPFLFVTVVQSKNQNQPNPWHVEMERNKKKNTKNNEKTSYKVFIIQSSFLCWFTIETHEDITYNFYYLIWQFLFLSLVDNISKQTNRSVKKKQ